MATAAKDATLTSVRSHSVSLGVNFHGEVEREELYPTCHATWRGQELGVELEANRYRHSSGWSEWRIFPRRAGEIGEAYANGYEPIADTATGTARSALGDACRPLVEEWIASDEYTASRREAFARMIRNHLRDERYNVDRTRKLLDLYRAELDPDHHARLTVAANTLETFLGLIEA